MGVSPSVSQDSCSAGEAPPATSLPGAPGAATQPPIVDSSGGEPPYVDTAELVGPPPAAPINVTGLISQQPADRASRRPSRRSHRSRSGSSSRCLARSRRSRSAGSPRRRYRRYRSKSRSHGQSGRTRSSSSDSGSWSSSASDHHSRHRSRRREPVEPTRDSSRGGSRPRAVAMGVPMFPPASSSSTLPATFTAGQSTSAGNLVSARGISSVVSGGVSAGSPVSAPPVGPGEGSLMPLIAASVPAATCRAHDRPLPTVCFLGHSYIFRAAQRAECRPGGQALGFRNVHVRWQGVEGLRWPEVLPKVVALAGSVRPPVVLVLHAGGNDICFLQVPKIITLMQADVERITRFFSEVVIVWSEIVPRVTWPGPRETSIVERARRTVNSRMARFVRSKGGVVVRHRQLEGDNRRLMTTDGVHLNDVGMDVFLSGLQDGVKQALFLLGGGQSDV